MEPIQHLHLDEENETVGYMKVDRYNQEKIERIAAHYADRKSVV